MVETLTTTEQQLEALEKEYESKRQNLETQKEELPHPKETLKEVVKEKIQQVTPTEPPTSMTVQPPPQTEPPSYLSPELKDKVQELVTNVFTIGLDKTIKEVQKINNPAISEAFHGALVDQLYPELVKRGVIKEIK